MAAAVQVATRVSPQVKLKASRVFEHYGLDTATALRMFLTVTADEQRIPIGIDRPLVEDFPNPETAEAIRQGNEFLASGKPGRYRNADELFEALDL
ncbi:MAG: type II toxin-antitoxin system RelB/DinJ family antitoxin [Coriobacteriales bacterium]|jgi:DNA-damage-inducible protein J|nr:type II toxin-antitoxin system RelB/DinJ family antitoxin [Coriobacteriales bacterium]